MTIPIQLGTPLHVAPLDHDDDLSRWTVSANTHSVLRCESGDATPGMFTSGSTVVVHHIWEATPLTMQMTVIACDDRVLLLGWPRPNPDPRRHRRASVDRNVTLAPKHGPVLGGRTLDVSQGGCRVIADGPLDVGVSVVVAFDLGNGPVSAVGNVLACIELGPLAELRIFFSVIDTDAAATIAAWIDAGIRDDETDACS